MSDRELLTECLEALTHDAAQRTFAGGVRMSQLAIKLRTHLAAPEPEPVAYFDLQKQVFYWAKPTMIDVPMTVALNPLPLYAAPPAAAPESTHPGYIIGNHWLETAYSRVCAGEAEADVLRDCGWERVGDADALRRSVEALRRENKRLHTVALQAQNAVIDLAKQPLTTADPDMPCSFPHCCDKAGNRCPRMFAGQCSGPRAADSQQVGR